MHQITRKLEFDAGHRVLEHGGKCRNLHGHRYVAEVTVESDELDKLGMVVDFSEVKRLVGGWIDEHWDHNMILHPDDPLILNKTSTEIETVTGRKPFIMPFGVENPTAENMVKVLFKVSSNLLCPQQLLVVKVRLYETPNCWAECWSE